MRAAAGLLLLALARPATGQDAPPLKTIEIQIINEWNPVKLPELARMAEVVVVATIRGGRSWLTPPESIQTDYDVAVEQIVKARRSDALKAGATLTLRKDGGVVERDGKPLYATESDFPPFKTGGRYVLFLKHAPDGPHYWSQGGPQGAFEILDDGVRQVSEAFGSWNRERGTKTALRPFLDEVRRLMR
jgi:hypothetical protein